MPREFILQGLTERTHAAALKEMFSGDVVRAIISVAFITENGVEWIKPLLTPYAGNVTVFAGIRNDITSAQALRLLLEIGVTVYGVDTGSRTVIFHPKLYYVCRNQSAQLSVGSANLTLGGLNNNVEGGILLNLDLAANDDMTFCTDLEDLFDGLPAAHPQNIIQILNAAAIEALLAAGRIIDETSARPPTPVTSARVGSSDPTPRMTLLPPTIRGKKKVKVAPTAPIVPSLVSPLPTVLGVPTPIAPNIVTGQVAAVTPNAIVVPVPSPPLPPTLATTAGMNLELVWESNPLSRRSLGIPTGATSNPTGSTTLGSGTFTHIDRVTYFRNYLFGYLPWVTNGQIETADEHFDLVIKGVFLGNFVLTVRHSLTRAARAPIDHNSPSGLSWNSAMTRVARPDLLGRTMQIWRASTDHTKFRIDID